MNWIIGHNWDIYIRDNIKTSRVYKLLALYCTLLKSDHRYGLHQRWWMPGQEKQRCSVRWSGLLATSIVTVPRRGDECQDRRSSGVRCGDRGCWRHQSWLCRGGAWPAEVICDDLRLFDKRGRTYQNGPARKWYLTLLIGYRNKAVSEPL